MPDGTQYTPQEFAARIKTKYPAYASIPDDQLVEKVTAKYPQYKAQIKQQAGTPIDTKAQGTISAQPSTYEKIKAGAKSVAMDPFSAPFNPFKLPEAVGSLTTGIENYTQEGRKEHPILSKVGDATKAGKDYANLLAITLGITGGEGIVGDAAAASMASKLEPTQKINEILGVTAKEIIPGKLPQSLDEFAVNPARGVLKAGIDERKLAKLEPIERYNEMTKAKDAAGRKLGQVLEQAGKQGVTVDAYSTITKAFSKLEPAEISKAEKMLQEIFSKQGIDIGDLEKLTPQKANALKQALWEDGSQAAEEIRRGIAESIKTKVPGAKDDLRNYADLAGAEKAARRGAAKFASKAPESALRKYLKKNIAPRVAEGVGIGGAGAGLYGLYKVLFGGGARPQQ
jgi:hypothetical protein